MNDIVNATSNTPDHSGATNDDAFISGWLGMKRNDNTRRAYLAAVEPLMEELGTMGATLRTCNVAHLQAWSETIAHYSPATQRQRIAAVKSLFSFAHATGYSAFNVAAVLTAPKAPNQLAERILTEEEVLRLFMAAKGRTARMLRILYYSGMRRSELSALCWEQVHYQDDGSVVLTVHGKGGVTRHIPLTAEQAAYLGEPGAAKDYVFSTRTGRPVHPGEVRNIVARATERTPGLEGRGVSPHWLRHSHATHALNRGCPPQILRAILGHASLETTTRYAHVSASESSARYLMSC